MAFKQLGNIDIDGTTNTVSTNYTLYTVPANKQTIVSTILAVNRNGSTSDIIVYHVPSGDSAAVENQLPKIQLAASGTSDGYTAFTLGISMAEGDTIVVSAGTVDTNFIAWGDELDV